MTQKISSSNIETATLASFSGPTIANVSIANSTYTLLDDTAVSNAGGYVVITGSNFTSGAQVLFGSTSATSVTFVDSTQLNVQVPALTAGSYVVYVQNGDGSTAVRLNGITSSPIPVWSTGSTLTNQDSGTPISISLSATSDSNVTYSVANGSSLPSGTTLAANGLFSGTVTIESEITYNFTINAIDAENQETLRSFSVTVNAGDLFYYLTSLHLSGEAPANNWISDASTNNFALTVNGDTRPMAFSPYETVWSNLFDGTGDYLSIAPNALNDLSGDFTVEAWIYRTVIGTLHPIFDLGDYQGASGILFYVTSGNALAIFTNNGLAMSGGTIPATNWTHVALVRSGSGSGNTRLYLNGVSVGTPATSTATFSGSLLVGADLYGGATTNFMNGYISNLRVLKGTALYTTNFTPPTSPLTAIANTSLLTCQSNRLIDVSNNNFTLTKNGDVSVSNFGPFTETDLVTGSGYFDGTGDWLTTASNAALNLGTGDFTLEAWIYVTTFGSNSSILDKRVTAGSIAPWVWYTDTAGKLNFYTGTNYITTTTFPLNTWTHVVTSRVNGTLYQFINGVSAMTPTSVTTDLDTSATLLIGSSNDSPQVFFKGYISNLRIVKGSGVSTVTVPTSPLTAIANTSLLTLQNRFGENNNRFVDTSGINSVVTRNGNVTQGTFSPFSQTGWSNYFDGTGDWLSLSDNAALQMGSGNFTIEFWWYPTSLAGYPSPYDKGYTGSGGLLLQTGNGDGRLVVWASGSAVLTSSTSVNLNAWNHVAVVRNSNTITIYQNGVSTGSVSNSTNFNNSASTGIGSSVTTSNFPVTGYLSNFRIVKGTAVYTSAFTPPTQSLTAIANTSLLTCQSNRLIDASTNNFTLTKNGDVSVQVFSPIKPSTDYSIANVGGSMYFDGTGDYLLVPDNAALESFTDFTIEFWVYFNSVSGTQVILDKGWNNGGGYSPYFILLSGGNLLAYASSSGTVNDVLSGASFGAMVAGQWYHIALTRSGSSIRLFTNGVVITSATNSATLMNSTNALGIGSVPLTGALLLNGYLSNLRIIKGAAAYTANTSPPTSPVLPVAGTTLLLNGTNGGIIDYTSKNNLETVGNVQLSTSVKKFGNTSLFFDGSGDYLVIPNSQNFVFGSGDWTIELWVRPGATGRQGFAALQNSAGTNVPWELGINNGNTFRVLVQTASGQAIVDGSTSVSTNTWYHVAAVRNGSTVTLYVNGISEGTPANISTNSLVSETSPVYVGTYNYGFVLTGYIDDLRITKGVARYTSNFTAPTSAFKTR